MICYVDTSALAKRYLPEPRADETDSFLTVQAQLLVSGLTTVEMRSLLARRRRLNELSSAQEMMVFASYLDDITQGFLSERPVTADLFAAAMHMFSLLPDQPLRTLDALHLAACQQHGAQVLATADGHMRAAAAALGMAVEYFGPP